MRKKNIKKPLRVYGLFVLCFMVMGMATAQIHIGSGATLHYAGGDFTSGIIDNNHGGTFSISASYAHSATNYVDGAVSFIAGGGTFDVSLESGAEQRVPNFTATGVGTVTYAVTAPTGTFTDNVFADKGLYTFTGAITAASATPETGTVFTNGDGTTKTIFAASNGGTWGETFAAGVMSFGQADKTLGIDDVSLGNFSLYPNPLKVNATSINYQLPIGVEQLTISMYNVTGKVIMRYKNVPVQMGLNSINKPGVARGLYLMQFSFNNGKHIVAKKLIIE